LIHDAVIVGAGPTGLACGIELKKLGLRALLLDKGCLVNSLYHYPAQMTFFTTPELLEIGGLPMTSLNEKPNRVEALKYYRRCSQYFSLDVRQYERVQSVAGVDGAFAVITDKTRYAARKVILATGYYDIPNRLNVPGEDLPKVIHYYKESHPYFNHEVLVVGAKNSAAIAALELHWSGARVTLVHRGGAISDRVKYWIRPNIENRIKSGEIAAHFNTTVASIREDAVDLLTPAGSKTISNYFVFAMTGYRPDFEFLEAQGVRLDAATGRPVVHPDTFESERPGLYLAGVIVAGIHTNEIFIENGRFHGEAIARDIASRITRA
jgi:thioredoxin reductase (NADPH)